MIGWLKGVIIDRQQPGKLVLDVNGVGYDVDTSLQTFFQLELQPGPVSLHIHTVVREDALVLYGFYNLAERALFRALIKVNGVGPKLAMAILSGIQPQEFIQCIHQNNTAMLARLPGIGKKTAERLVVEMRDNLQQFEPLSMAALGDSAVPSMQPDSQSEAVQALEALGYKSHEAVKVVKKIDDGNKTCEQLIRQALQLLASC